jgi:hypothetical protein
MSDRKNEMDMPSTALPAMTRIIEQKKKWY